MKYLVAVGNSYSIMHTENDLNIW